MARRKNTDNVPAMAPVEVAIGPQSGPTGRVVRGDIIGDGDPLAGIVSTVRWAPPKVADVPVVVAVSSCASKIGGHIVRLRRGDPYPVDHEFVKGSPLLFTSTPWTPPPLTVDEHSRVKA